MAWPAPLRELCEVHGCVAAGYGMNGWVGMWDTCLYYGNTMPNLVGETEPTM